MGTATSGAERRAERIVTAMGLIGASAGWNGGDRKERKKEYVYS